MSNSRLQSDDDLHADKNLQRIDDLETFRKEFQGKEFDKKILDSIKDSHPIREELQSIIWQTFRNKITWIILGFVGLILTDLIIRAIPHILATIAGH